MSLATIRIRALPVSPLKITMLRGIPGPVGSPGGQGEPGEPGTDGNTIAAGSGAPVAAGNDGDLYIDTGTGNLYRWED